MKRLTGVCEVEAQSADFILTSEVKPEEVD